MVCDSVVRVEMNGERGWSAWKKVAAQSRRSFWLVILLRGLRVARRQMRRNLARLRTYSRGRRIKGEIRRRGRRGWTSDLIDESVSNAPAHFVSGFYELFKDVEIPDKRGLTWGVAW